MRRYNSRLLVAVSRMKDKRLIGTPRSVLACRRQLRISRFGSLIHIVTSRVHDQLWMAHNTPRANKVV